MLYNNNWNNIEKNKIETIIKDKKIIIYGASIRNKKLLDFLPKEKISYICDRQVFKNGTKSYDIPVYSIDKLKEEKDRNIIIITVIREYKELYNIFQQFKIKEYFFGDIDFGKKYIDYYWHDDLVKIINSHFNIDKKYAYINFIPDDKFVEPLINIITDYFNIKEHVFIIYNIGVGNKNNRYDTWDLYKKVSEDYCNVYLIDNLINIKGNDIKLQLNYILKVFQTSIKICLHSGFFCKEIEKFFTEHIQMIREKTGWIPWGGERLISKSSSDFRKILGKCRYVYNNNNKNYQEIVVKYGLRPEQEKKNPFICSRYSYYRLPERGIHNDKVVNILLGFGARKYILYHEGIEKLKKFNNKEIKIYCSLSYGDLEQEEVRSIIQHGIKVFGDKFQACMKFIGYREYPAFLEKMDIAIIPVTECIGETTISLLMQLNRKIYLHNKEETCPEKVKSGYYFYDFDKIDLEDFDMFRNYSYKEKNDKLMFEKDIHENLIKGWRVVYNDSF